MADYNYPLIVSVLLCLLAIGMMVGHFMDQTEDPETKKKTPKPVYLYVGVVAFVGAWIAALYAYYLETKSVDLVKRCVKVDDPNDMDMCIGELDKVFAGDLSKFNLEKKQIKIQSMCEQNLQPPSSCQGLDGEGLEECQQTQSLFETEKGNCKVQLMNNVELKTIRNIQEAFNSFQKQVPDNINSNLKILKDQKASQQRQAQQQQQQIQQVQQQQMQQMQNK